MTHLTKRIGYQDSGADIAYTLSQTGHKILTPISSPDPRRQQDWCFPDTEEGILAAIHAGATHLWANTVVFAEHPLQESGALTPYEDRVKVVGQPPLCVDWFDDKAVLNDKLRRRGGFTLPRAWSVDGTAETGGQGNLETVIASLAQSDYPLVAKPVRGRGSHGVQVCNSPAELRDHVNRFFNETSSQVLLEEYLHGEEGTVTIMPPDCVDSRHWALPPVVRFNHVDGIAPYSGLVAVTANSRAVTKREMEADESFACIMRECEEVGVFLGATAPIRIDIRRFREGGRFALFDVNLKPNMTGPGRPGRKDQASLMALAAQERGWDYPAFLRYMLGNARFLREMRKYSCLRD
ncbi:hypothetical protein AWENTII_007024 [Aspergillus wentii]